MDRFQPSFYTYPRQNNRTGFHPVWTPTILVVPWSIDINGNTINNSRVWDVTFGISKSSVTPVAGHDHVGIYNPDYNIYELKLNDVQLNDVIIDMDSVDFYHNGQLITREEAVIGDEFGYTLVRGIMSKMTYYPDAIYYDLSSFEIPVSQLPHDKYIFTWSAKYHQRITLEDQLVCITEDESIAASEYDVNHPGEIHARMIADTPNVYHAENSLSDFYRPIADMLQDVFDEQGLLRGVNWVNKIPAQLMPYLAYLVGIDLPSFRQVDLEQLDKMRRSMLNKGVYLQKLKGTKRALVELFETFGFIIDVTTLWSSANGNFFLAPGEKVQEGDMIELETVSQTDPILNAFNDPGFGSITVPLLYKNNNDNAVIDTFLVENDSDAELTLSDILDDLSNNPDSLIGYPIVNDINNVILPCELFKKLKKQQYSDSCTRNPYEFKNGVIGYSVVSFSDIENLYEYSYKKNPVSYDNIEYDKTKYIINMTLNSYNNFSGYKAYSFVSYSRNKIIVPESLRNLQSNRFDINIISKFDEFIDSNLYDFVIDFIMKLKPFHSLLRKIAYDVNFEDIYNVNDFSVGGDFAQSSDVDAGNLQIPPAVKPTEATEGVCRAGLEKRGFKDTDIDFRTRVLSGLKEEYDSWRLINDTHIVPDDKRQELQSISNITIPSKDFDGYNYLGQDRFTEYLTVSGDRGLPVGEIYNATPVLISGKLYFDIGTPTPLLVIDNRSIILPEFSTNVLLKVIKNVGTNKYQIELLNLSEYPKVKSIDERSIPNYVYNGRVIDNNVVNREIPLCDTFLFNTCQLSIGTGLYYTYNQCINSSDLHYDNRSYFDQICQPTINTPSLYIDKYTQTMPGCRHIEMCNMVNNYTHPIYKARPWDFDDICDCGNLPINPLNATIIDDVLIYDDGQLIYYGNGVIPDIVSLSGVAEVGTFIVHKIFTNCESRIWDDEIYELVYTNLSSINSDYKLFESAIQAASSGWDDFIDGYFADYGQQSVDIGLYNVSRDSHLYDHVPNVDGIINIDARLCSSVKTENPNYTGYRLDCACLSFSGTNGTNTTNADCDVDNYIDAYGNYDFNPDKIEINRIISLTEKFSGFTYHLDGEIDNLGDPINVIDDLVGVPIGEYGYVDDYGSIYDVKFETNGIVIDSTTTIFSPNVWMEFPDGYIDNKKVFRKGILTTYRTVTTVNNGSYEILNEEFDQHIAYGQSNFVCPDRRPDDPFNKYLDYMIDDSIDMVVSTGPRWTRVNYSTDSVPWCRPTSGTGGTGSWCDESFWMNVWG